ncbi:NADP-dependent oxidoreductase [Streptomyces sp. NPDC005892]|uniref:NADP-dependent oxidoreductase n=1 Tax=Streptomyces sp. NPDC005892 TaxID=3155593 RepID=UPI0033DB3ED7
MRAVAVTALLGEPALVELPKPDPEPGEVRVRIEYAALNPRDWQRADAPAAGSSPQGLPHVLGVDFAGRVDMIGRGPSRFRVGDAVFGRVAHPLPGRGAYADYVSVHQDSPIALVPAGLSLKVAAALPTAGTAACQILAASGAGEGDSLLIVGAAGGIGSYLTQLASARGVRVLAAVRGDERRRMAILGAARTLDVSAGPESLPTAVREGCPQGVDALADLVSETPDAFAAHVALVREGGIALTTRGATGTPGNRTRHVGPPPVDFRLAPSALLLDALAAAVTSGAFVVPIDVELPLEKAPGALAQNRAGGARGKTVFVLRPGGGAGHPTR